MILWSYLFKCKLYFCYSFVLAAQVHPRQQDGVVHLLSRRTRPRQARRIRLGILGLALQLKGECTYMILSSYFCFISDVYACSSAATGGGRRASAQASLENNIFFGSGANQNPQQSNLVSGNTDPFSVGNSQNVKTASSSAPKQPDQSDFFVNSSSVPPPVPASAANTDLFASNSAPLTTSNDDPFAAFGSNPVVPPVPQGPSAESTEAGQLFDPFGSDKVLDRPASIATSSTEPGNSWGFGDNTDFFSPPPSQPNTQASIEDRGFFQSPGFFLLSFRLFGFCNSLFLSAFF